jgi:hypothetical protein
MADMLTIWHKTDDKDWHQVKMHAVDANEAMQADPDHWKANKPEPEPEPLLGEAHDAESDGTEETE